jgi:hypothetical protein
VTSGNWSDGNGWTAGEPGPGARAVVCNGGTVTVNQAGEAACELVLGAACTESGTVHMTGGRLEANSVTVGGRGTGSFTQSDGNHYVQQTLSIAMESNSIGAYNLQGGNLFAGEVVVGGSSTARGGIGTFTISGGDAGVSGELVIWDGSAAHLGAGTLANLDSNHPYVDVENSGTLYIEDGVYCLGRLTGIGDTWTGKTVVRSGATLWVESMEQDTLVIEAGGEVHFAAENYELFMSLARENQSQVPEPGTLALIGIGVLMLGRRRGRRS